MQTLNSFQFAQEEEEEEEKTRLSRIWPQLASRKSQVATRELLLI